MRGPTWHSTRFLLSRYLRAAARWLLPVALLAPIGCAARRHPTRDHAPQGSPSPLFEDVAERAGIRFRHTNGATGHLYFLEITPAGCAFFDYDKDGYPDVLLVQSGPSDPVTAVHRRPPCTLYHNNGNGTFTDVTPGSGLDRDLGYCQGVAVGDYDNDGYDDLFITSFGRNHLLHNDVFRRSGVQVLGKARSEPPIFRDVTTQMGLAKLHSTGYATSAAFGDYDNDGRLDLYVCYYAPWKWSVDTPCHDPLGNREYCSPELYPEETHRLYRNDGDHFTDVSDKAGITKATGRGLGAAWLDYDGDGRQDIFVANDLSPNMLWHNNDGKTFTNVAVEAGCAYDYTDRRMAGMGVAVADYDHSGRDSLFVGNFSGKPNALFRNTGGLFQDVSIASGLALPHMPYLTFGCEFLDYHADGWPDLIVANGHVLLHPERLEPGVAYKERKQLFHNRGDGTFSEVTDSNLLGSLALPTVSRGLAVGDFDNDGRLDVLVNNQNGPAQLFRNRDHSRHHWIGFRSVGVRSNRDGLHARYILTAGGMVQSASVRAGSSYLSHSDTRVYFGLGQTDLVAQVEVRWPSGAHDVMKNLRADSYYIVTEGEGITGRLPAR